jgi:hypothetical protein
MFKILLRCTVAFVAVFLIPSTAFSQEQLGMRIERYGGIYSATLNPAAMAFNPLDWDISLFSADVFVNNSYAFLKNTSIPHALANSNKIVSVVDGPKDTRPGPDAIFLDYFDDNKKMFAVVQARVSGPSFSFRFGDHNTIGLTTAFRTNISAYRLPEILRYRTIRDLPRNTAINIPPAGLTGMAWTEIGIPFSHLNSEGGRVTAFGLTPKLLLGLEGFYSRAQSKFDYTQRQNDTVAFGNARWDYGLTTDYLTNNTSQVKPRINGAGFGLDLGFSWAQLADENGSPSDYLWRIGASLTDIGFVRFGRNAEQHQINFDNTIAVSKTDFPKTSDPHAYLTDISQAFLGNPAASLQSRAFSIGLPMAASVQVDYRLSPGVYVAGVWTQRLPLLPHSLKQPSTIAVVPRLEHRWLSLSLPVVVSDYEFVRVGLAARLGVLYLGTDNLGSFLTSAKQTGTDFYVGLKINAFSIHLWDKSAHAGSGKNKHERSVRGIKCYDF